MLAREGHRRAPQPARRRRGARRQSRRGRRGVSARRAPGRRPRSTCSTGATTCCSCARSTPATEVFTAAIARHPKSARLHVGLGIAQYSRGQYEDAVKSFCQAADLAPSDPRPYQFLGEMYGVAPGARAARSRERLARFVKLQPRNALGALLLRDEPLEGRRAGDAGTAICAASRRCCGEAVALDAEAARRRSCSSASCSPSSGASRRRSARSSRRRRSSPTVAQAHYRLAQAYQRTGQQDACRQGARDVRAAEGARIRFKAAGRRPARTSPTELASLLTYPSTRVTAFGLSTGGRTAGYSPPSSFT